MSARTRRSTVRWETPVCRAMVASGAFRARGIDVPPFPPGHEEEERDVHQHVVNLGRVAA